MIVRIETLPTVKIVLSNDEAIWLMSFIQKYPDNHEEEPEACFEYRKELFEALKLILT